MEIMAGVCLFLQSVWDIRTKEIPLWISLGFGCCSFLYSICCERGWSSFAFAILPGILCLFLGFCTRQAIGYGDGILLCSLAMLYSLEDLMELIIIAVFFAGIMAFVLLIIFHKNRKDEVPFVPFLFLSWLILQCMHAAGGLV